MEYYRKADSFESAFFIFASSKLAGLRGDFKPFYEQKIEAVKEKRDARHDCIAIAGTESNHQQCCASRGNMFKGTLLFNGKEEVEKN